MISKELIAAIEVSGLTLVFLSAISALIKPRLAKHANEFWFMLMVSGFVCVALAPTLGFIYYADDRAVSGFFANCGFVLLALVATMMLITTIRKKLEARNQPTLLWSGSVDNTQRVVTFRFEGNLNDTKPFSVYFNENSDADKIDENLIVKTTISIYRKPA